MKFTRFAAVVLIAAMAAACGKGKQEAAVALDEARLSVGEARKSGADPMTHRWMADAESTLGAAEKSFQEGKYGKAKESAEKAAGAARLARAEAGASAKPVGKRAAAAKSKAKGRR